MPDSAILRCAHKACDINQIHEKKLRPECLGQWILTWSPHIMEEKQASVYRDIINLSRQAE